MCGAYSSEYGIHFMSVRKRPLALLSTFIYLAFLVAEEMLHGSLCFSSNKLWDEEVNLIEHKKMLRVLY